VVLSGERNKAGGGVDARIAMTVAPCELRRVMRGAGYRCGA
jgi:hypothetical protein